VPHALGENEGQKRSALNALAHDTAIDAPDGVPGVVFGRFMLPDMSEHACQVVDLDTNGATFLTSDVPAMNMAIVAYLEDLGRVEVTSKDVVPGGFRVASAYTGARLERLLQRIEWVRERASGGADQRRHPRFEPRDKHSSIMLPDGRSYTCEVMDISVSGAAVKTDVMPSIGTYLMVGKMRGRVVRYLENGVAIEFVKQLERPQLAQQVA
jgi:hypothetical protein